MSDCSRARRATRFLVLVASLATVVVPPLAAQRKDAEAEFQKRKITISYGAVPVGRNKVDDLAVGTNWRMGNNHASTITTQMPVMSGDVIVVPGSYRVNIARPQQDAFALNVDGGDAAFTPLGGGQPTQIPGKLDKLQPGSKSLEVVVKPEGKATPAGQPVKVLVDFGENRLTVPMTLIGTSSTKSGTWTLDTFAIPSDVLEKRLADGKATPIAALKKETGDRKAPLVLNVLLTKDGASLAHAMEAPTEQFGFGAVKPPDPATTVKATAVTWDAAPQKKPNLALEKFEAKKGAPFTIVVIAGDQRATITLPEPPAPASK
jgi:hypothetical protein